MEIGTKSGKVKIVSTHGCEVTSSEEFTVCPAITSLTVTATDAVLPGDTFKINGKGFTDVNDVKIGDESVEFDRLSSTEIEVTVGEKSGKVTVITDQCSESSTQDITVPGAGFTYYDISGSMIDSADQHLIEKNAVKRMDEREGKTEYRLEVDHDPSDPPSSSGYLENFGNPSPKTGKYWYAYNKMVDIRIDGIVYEPTRDTRHVCTGYTLSKESGGEFRDEFVRKSQQDEHDFQMRMDGPKKVFFRWKPQYSFKVMSMPASMGDNLSPKPGTYWYDSGTSKNASARDGCLKVTGYRDNIDAVTETMPGTNKTYKMDRPVQITWQYEAHNYRETVIIGNPITFSGVPSYVLGRSDTETEPVKPATSTDPSQADQGAEELCYWSPSDKKLFPLIGGSTFQVEWKNKGGGQCEQKLISTITAEWPDSPHYVHVAEAPPVPLDPQEDDRFAFKSLKYFSTDAQVSSALEFTATKPGKSTLLFTRTSSGAATGDEYAEPAYVRVVETRIWTENKEDSTAEIGRNLTSQHHDAGTPHNGYVFWEKARYNANVYDRATMQGQIFPVNRQFTDSPEDKLLVIWYQIIDNISWPWKPVKYNCNWPENADEKTAEGTLSRIVIASREGSECKGSDGKYQTWPDWNGEMQNYLDPARYKDVQIYQQPDPNLPGYNPNEEHAVATSSFRHKKMASPPSETIKAYFKPMNRGFMDESGEDITGEEGESADIPELFSHFFDSDLAESSVTSSDFSGTLEIEFPVSAGKYSFQAPAEWGMRKSPGEIHQALIELVKAEADLQIILSDYAGLMSDIQIATDLLEARSDLNAEELRIGNEWAEQVKGFNTTIIGLRTGAATADLVGEGRIYKLGESPNSLETHFGMDPQSSLRDWTNCACPTPAMNCRAVLTSPSGTIPPTCKCAGNDPGKFRVRKRSLRDNSPNL